MMLSVESAKQALTDILQTIRQPPNASRLQDALGVAGNDMLKRMQYVFPVLTQIEMEVIVRHGFSGNCDGLTKFTQEINMLAKQDNEVKRLNDEVRDIFLPRLQNMVDSQRLQ